MTVRALRDCKQHKIQEFARIIFVANIFKHVRMLEDHEPLDERPTYESLDVPKIVSCFFSHFRCTQLIDHNRHLQSLSDPETNCLTSDSYCVAALQQKITPNSENLRNLPAKQIRLDLEFVAVKKRPHNYISKSKNSRCNTSFIIVKSLFNLLPINRLQI